MYTGPLSFQDEANQDYRALVLRKQALGMSVEGHAHFNPFLFVTLLALEFLENGGRKKTEAWNRAQGVMGSIKRNKGLWTNLCYSQGVIRSLKPPPPPHVNGGEMWVSGH